ncbi:MAG: AGE family epimerase/isomerase [Bacteroidales bacterium]|nr:AGE family epimerase/isomerase [Bacteroidales bacterium]
MSISNRNNSSPGISTDRLAIADEMEAVLTKGMMDIWYPLCIDKEFGGFLSNFDKAWNQKERQQKFIVTQARHTWATAQMAKMYPENKLYREYSEHGYKFLRDVMWDKEYGGYFTMTNREGKVSEDDRYKITKIAYGNAFAIYGLAAYFEISHDSSALELAIRSFQWLDKHSHDPEYGGYFQFMQKDGTPLVEGHDGTPPKDQNSSIHLIEGFTELYKVWKDDHLKSRINELLVIIRDTITTEKGHMNLFFRQDWSPVYYTDETFRGGINEHQFDHVSFGHDIETAYLLLEASEAIGIVNDTKTHRISKKMTDHTIINGWDDELGATYDAGYYFEDGVMTILNKHTAFWVSTESFHTMLIMSGLYPDDPMDYYDKFALTWDYCKNYLIDHENGGWYINGLNEVPESVNADKGGIWKGNYHSARSLINCINILRNIESDHQH